MKPRERRETGEQDLFRARLDQIIDLKHPLVKLALTIDWRFLEHRFGEVYEDGPGQPPLPTRLMAGLAILKHTYAVALFDAVEGCEVASARAGFEAWLMNAVLARNMQAAG
jgi:hypothetical protein